MIIYSHMHHRLNDNQLMCLYIKEDRVGYKLKCIGVFNTQWYENHARLERISSDHPCKTVYDYISQCQ